MTAVYRNLNKARKDPSVFVWSVAGHSSTGGSLRKLERHTSSVTLAAPRATVKPKAMERIRVKAVREVGAWIYGTEVAHITGQRRAFTLNPLPASRNGRSEAAFHYCEVVGGRLVIGEAVDFSALLGVEFRSDGAYAIVA